MQLVDEQRSAACQLLHHSSPQDANDALRGCVTLVKRYQPVASGGALIRTAVPSGGGGTAASTDKLIVSAAANSVRSFHWQKSSNVGNPIACLTAPVSTILSVELSV